MKLHRLLSVALIFVVLQSVPVIADVTAAKTTDSASTSTATVTTTPTVGSPSSAKPVWVDTTTTDQQEKNDKLQHYSATPAPTAPVFGQLVELYSFALPANVTEQLRYTSYPLPFHYLINLNGATMTVRKEPRRNGAVMYQVGAYQNIQTDAAVIGEALGTPASDRWFRVQYWSRNQMYTGYVHCSVATKRTVQLGKMIDQLNHMKADVDNNVTAYISNYKNITGTAPRHKGADVDSYGRLRAESAAAYHSLDAGSDFRYFQDGTLLNVLGSVGNYYKVTSIDYEGVYYVEKRFVSMRNSIDKLTKAIIVDRNNQNEGVFESVNGKWVLISAQRVSTGAHTATKQPTDLGDYMVIERKAKFEYEDEKTKEIAGYSPYALRFNGGAYIHSVPVNYILEKKKVEVKPAVRDILGNIVTPAVTKEVIANRKDPGHREFFPLIGTYPRTHKCVNNYTSHAKFLYDWAEVGKTGVIVIE